MRSAMALSRGREEAAEARRGGGRFWGLGFWGGRDKYQAFRSGKRKTCLLSRQAWPVRHATARSLNASSSCCRKWNGSAPSEISFGGDFFALSLSRFISQCLLWHIASVACLLLGALLGSGVRASAAQRGRRSGARSGAASRWVTLDQQKRPEACGRKGEKGPTKDSPSDYSPSPALSVGWSLTTVCSLANPLCLPHLVRPASWLPMQLWKIKQVPPK